MKADRELLADISEILNLERSLQTTEPTVETVPTISSSAMLVELGISQWIGKKQDKKVSAEVENDKDAERGTTRVNKTLLPREPLFEAIASIVGEARTYHYHATMPWLDSGPRLLTTPMFFDYQKQLTSYQVRFDDAVNNFIEEYPDMVMRAPSKLKGMFDLADYPDADTLRAKFKFNINFAPVPEAGDFRVNVGNDALAQLKDSYTSYYTTQLQNAYKDVWQRTHTVLSRMSDKLAGEDKQVFRDTLVSNVQDMVDLLAKFNVTDDPIMRKAQARIENALLGITPEALREDDYLRLDTKRKVDDLLKDFSW